MAFVPDTSGSAVGHLYVGESGWLARSLTDHRSVDCGDARDHRSQAVWVVGVAGLLGVVTAIPRWRRGQLVFAFLLSAVAAYLLAGVALEGPLLSLGLAVIGTSLLAADTWRRWATDGKAIASRTPRPVTASATLAGAAIGLAVLALVALWVSAVRVPASAEWPVDICRSGVGAGDHGSSTGLVQTLLTDHRAYSGSECSDVISERRQFIAGGLWVLGVTLVSVLRPWSKRSLVVLLVLLVPGGLFALAGAILDGPVFPMALLFVAATLTTIDDARRIRSSRPESLGV